MKNEKRKMKNDVLKDKSFLFAVRVVKLCQWLQNEKQEYVLSKQILRSGTAIGALTSEAVFAQSKADFISKLSISLKEANETLYWIELLGATDYIDSKMSDSLTVELKEIVSILVSSIKTAKNNLSKNEE